MKRIWSHYWVTLRAPQLVTESCWSSKLFLSCMVCVLKLQSLQILMKQRSARAASSTEAKSSPSLLDHRDTDAVGAALALQCNTNRNTCENEIASFREGWEIIWAPAVSFVSSAVFLIWVPTWMSVISLLASTHFCSRWRSSFRFEQVDYLGAPCCVHTFLSAGTRESSEFFNTFNISK